MLEYDSEAAKLRIENASAEALLRVAAYFWTQHSLRLGKANPRPYLDSSKPGEYPRRRTGAGQSALAFEPTTREAVARTQAIRVGFRQNEPHLLILELRKDVTKRRLGLLKTLDDLRPQLAALARATK